jgi:Outer membrane protein beta-barrel domain
MKKLLFTFLLFSASAYVWAQESQDDEKNTQEAMPLVQGDKKHVHKDHLQKSKGIPVRLPNYGSLVIDSGLNFLRDCPSEINSQDWRARFSNINLYYNIHLGHSHFTISPGIGLSFEGYRLQKDHTLARNPTDTVFKKEGDSSDNVLSALDLRYLDLCMLARFNANSKRPKESFFIALGGKVGMLWKACATVRYKQHDEIKKRSNWETFNLSEVRYGVYARLGWGRFGLCYTHTLSSLFEGGRGPGKTTTKPWSLGISVDLF